MNASQIKLNLIQKIAQIEDVNLLEKIETFLNTSGSLYNDKISMSNNKEIEFNGTENFTDYIKEWVKDL